MNKKLAEKYFLRFKNAKIGNYSVTGLLNFGKSAVVFEGMDQEGNAVALKVFDNAIVKLGTATIFYT